MLEFISLALRVREGHTGLGCMLCNVRLKQCLVVLREPKEIVWSHVVSSSGICQLSVLRGTVGSAGTSLGAVAKHGVFLLTHAHTLTVLIIFSHRMPEVSRLASC